MNDLIPAQWPPENYYYIVQLCSGKWYASPECREEIYRVMDEDNFFEVLAVVWMWVVNLPELAFWGLLLWVSQVWLILMMFFDPYIVPNFRRENELAEGIAANLMHMYQRSQFFGIYQRFMLWLLEKNIAHFKPVRFIFSQFMNFWASYIPFIPDAWQKTDLRHFEITYMTWWEVLNYLTQELFFWPVIYGSAIMQFFATWWIYFAFWTAREVVWMIF